MTSPTCSGSTFDLVEVSGGGSIPNTPVPPTDAPITDAPITDAPITDAPITDAPITEAPITEAPITDEPVTPAPGDVIFSVGGVHYVAAGSQVNVDLTINGEYEANGMNIWVQYDAENLTLNNVENGEIMNAIGNLGGMNILDFTSIPGSVRSRLHASHQPGKRQRHDLHHELHRCGRP